MTWNIILLYMNGYVQYKCIWQISRGRMTGCEYWSNMFCDALEREKDGACIGIYENFNDYSTEAK